MSKQTQIGQTGLFVNPIGLGTNAVGGHNLYPNLDEEAGKELVRTAINEGVNFLDTAFIYGPGRSEELVGEVIKESGKRSEIILATKGAHKFVGEDVVLDNSPSYLKSLLKKAYSVCKRITLIYSISISLIMIRRRMKLWVPYNN